MNVIDFPGFLRHRFRAMIHIGFSSDVLQNYPIIYENIWNKWNEIERAGTSDFRFRLNFQEAFTDSIFGQFIQQNIPKPEQLPSVVGSSKDANYFAPWLYYWVAKMFIPADPRHWEEFLFTDVPVCYIYVSCAPEKMPKVAPPWMDPYSKDIPEFNLVVDPSCSPSSTTNPAFIPDPSLRSLHDFLVWIVEREAPAKLRKLRKETEDYVTQNWNGLRNSIMRFVGWGSGKPQRADTVKTLKRLGDLCMASGEFRAAFDYYQQLYQELNDDDPPVNDSLCIMFSVASMLTTDELDVVQLLSEVLKNREAGPDVHQYIIILLLSIFYATNHCRAKTTISLYKVLLRALQKSRELTCAKLAVPMIREAMSGLMDPRHRALYLYVAALEYRGLGLLDNAWICFWRSYNCIWETCWPRIAHALLLDISSIREPPDRLLHMLTHKNLNYVSQTVQQLKRISVNDLVFMNSIIVHDLVVNVTGFPYSPPPLGMAKGEWSRLRRWLFPVMYHPSTEEFAAEMWNTESEITRYRCAVGEEYTINLKLSTTLQEPCDISHLHLLIEPTDAADTDLLENVTILSTEQIRLTFVPTKATKFQVRGLWFLWFDVAPAAVLFPQPLMYEALEFESLVAMKLTESPQIAHVGIPCQFSADLVKVNGNILSLFVFAESYPPNSAAIQLIEPKVTGFHNKFSLDPSLDRQSLVFELTPNISGPITVRVFASYAGTGHEMRFVHEAFVVDSRDTKKVHYIPGSDRISLQPADDTYTVDCRCAVIEQRGSKVRFTDVVTSYLEKKCTVEVHRKFNDTTITDILYISNVFVTFREQDFKIAAFPAEITIDIDVLCLGANEGELSLRHPSSSALDFCWLGQTHFVIAGPKKLKLAAKLLVMRPICCDIGELVSIQYGNAKPVYHHEIEVSLC